MISIEGLLVIKLLNVLFLRCIILLGILFYFFFLGGGVEGVGLKWNNMIIILLCIL